MGAEKEARWGSGAFAALPHEDLEKGIYAGAYGWDHAAYWGIAEQKAGVDLTEWHSRTTPPASPDPPLTPPSGGEPPRKTTRNHQHHPQSPQEQMQAVLGLTSHQCSSKSMVI